ncbi:trinucleotide repeat-containing gene 6C protein isoform X2 [Orussus abietinus]|uniref:trinucleotide repeat-containing gene 6C protein isoform X2 n=1 Tax=Orussus abietinus TaxID=222816 RepID=UPI000C715F20|nr:trinucleotide repeat-containing gene 6C protein isoform X2 [Orussus abietinus]
MFPHNSSSHEISTETNAFVQNSKRDVVVLEGSSLSGVEEGEGPEHARYCDIEFINSSMMAAPTSHPEATAANDFLTVLPRQLGELRSAGAGEARQSVAPATTRNSTNHLLTYDNNNNKVNNHNNAEHNHHKYRKQNTPGSPGEDPGSSADNSKSTRKPLSDNKDSFSELSVRVLKLSVNVSVRVKGGDACRPAGVPSLVRIPKSDRPQRPSRVAASLDNYSLLGSRPLGGDNNNFKANLSVLSNNNNNSKSVILLSSNRYGDYYLLLIGGDSARSQDRVAGGAVSVLVAKGGPRAARSPGLGRHLVTGLARPRRRLGAHDAYAFAEPPRPGPGDFLKLHFDVVSVPAYAHKLIAVRRPVSSSNTLIVSKKGNVAGRARSSSTPPVGRVAVTKLQQRICVPLTIKLKVYGYEIGNNNNRRNSNNDNGVSVSFGNGEEINIRYNNRDVIEDIVNVAVCYKTSLTTTTNFRFLIGSHCDDDDDDADHDGGDDFDDDDDGISRTEATIFTVGALSFQDNDKSNEPLNASFKNDEYQVSTKVGLKDSTIKHVSKSTPSDKSSDKSDMSRATRLQYEGDERVRSEVNIPTLTTCEPTMTLTRQPATVTSQINAVPVYRVEQPSPDRSRPASAARDSIKLYATKRRQQPLLLLKCDRCGQPGENFLMARTCNLATLRDDQPWVVFGGNAATTPNQLESIVFEPSTATTTRLWRVPLELGLFGAYALNERGPPATRTIASANSNEVDVTRLRLGPARECKSISSNQVLCTYDKSRITAISNDDTFANVDVTQRPGEILSLARRGAFIARVRNLVLAQDANLRDALRNTLRMLFGTTLSKEQQFIHEYKKRWGIPTYLGLVGGGESTLNNGVPPNWGNAQATTPNNNNAAQSGWGTTPGNPPGSAGPPNNWATNSVNRPVTGNPNQNQNQLPPGPQNNPGNVNKANNPNQPPNSQSGPPTSQSNNSTQGNQNSGQWSQGKGNTAGGPGQNPSAQNNNNGGVQQQPSGSNANNNQQNNPVQGSVSSGNTPASNNPSTKQQLEQLNTMREALFSQDGWGCQHVNQDTNWDVPTSPEPSMTKDGVPMWKPPVNNGTDLWEANLRNGGQPPPQQQAKAPWGHTPSTNIGGTWGEDDESADSSNMWTNAPTPSQPNTAPWPGAAGNQAGMWGGGSNWGDPRMDPRDPRDLRSVDPREMRDPRDHRMSLDPRDHMRVMDPMGRDPRMADMRGDPRGISGRLNGASADAMWGQPPGPPHHQMGHQHPSGPPAKMLNQSSMNQWAAPPPKDMMPGKPSGWEEPSPPTQRRNVPNYDDGTSLWANPAANPRAIPSTKVSHWKDLPTSNLGRGGMQCPPGMPQNRMPGQPGMKPDVGGPMWSHPGGPGGRNGSWTDAPHDTVGWDDPKTPAAWNEPQLNPASWGGPSAHKPKPMGPTGSWVDDVDPPPSWAHPAKPVLTKEVIWNSREFRYLCELGYKKEDVEAALRSREMNRDEAQELLSQLRPLDHWRRHDAHGGYDPTNQASSAPAYPRFNHVAQQMSFPPGAGVPSGAATGGVSGSVASASLLKLQQQQQQQAAVQLQQQQPTTNAPQPPFNQASRTPQNQPSTQQLRMLVQQIQLAVQEGYLNHQILNQPLAPQTLILLNQLLQQIKVLQQLHQQHSVQSSLKGNGQTVLQISVQITKTKQQIANLQNQIAAQQATYMKQQQQQQHPAAPSQASEYYKTSVHDPMSALQNSFSDLAVNKEPPVSQQQSRLNQWKLPSLDKDSDIATNEFSRAPGTTSKPPTAPGGLTQSHSSPNLNPLLGQGDGTWSSRLGDSGWPDAGNSDSTDGKEWQPGGAAFTDLVPEFEPGKPWKMKSIEDDPSITPGSVVRSPLSLAAIKDPDAIFSSSSKTSPPPQTANVDTSIPSLSNSTWSFNPPATTPSAFTSSKNTWGDSAPPPTAVTSELWGAPMSKARGPPPGLGSKGAANASNGWAGLGTVGRSSSSWGLQSAGGNSGWVSTWLLLKNLTPQIDGSTLKTLCMQHGPVQDFRLYLNHGIALTKYSSRDEAIKAQGALNNCVLGNTTIFAESPADSEVHTLLQQLSHGGQQQTAGSGGSGWSLRPTNKTGPLPDTWGGTTSQLWGAPPTTNSLWGSAGIDTSDQQRATPSSLNSYLPGDLLGGESM